MSYRHYPENTTYSNDSLIVNFPVLNTKIDIINEWMNNNANKIENHVSLQRHEQHWKACRRCYHRHHHRHRHTGEMNHSFERDIFSFCRHHMNKWDAHFVFILVVSIHRTLPHILVRIYWHYFRTSYKGGCVFVRFFFSLVFLVTSYFRHRLRRRRCRRCRSYFLIYIYFIIRLNQFSAVNLIWHQMTWLNIVCICETVVATFLMCMTQWHIIP